jgi:2-polyprenyl-3-methyl-5-hydroxy-6-metoxy-1,4-benzoquinol methylase
MLGKRYENNGESCLRLNAIQERQKARIKERIDAGIYNFEPTVCPACSATDFESLSEKDRYGLYAPTAICRSCGLIQASPRMTQESYNHFYNDGHRKLYVGTEKPDDSYFKERYHAGQSTFNYISSFMDVPGMQILEVGCGSGAILKYFHDKGAIVKGIDLSLEYLEYGKNRYGIELSNTNLFELPDDHKYDLIIYSDVLEHILDPIGHLNKIKSILSPRGHLYIKVPGTKNLMRPYLGDFLKSLQNAHVYYFSLSTLDNLMNKAGFSCVHGDEAVRSLWTVTDGPQRNITNDYKPCMAYLHSLEQKNIQRKLLIAASWAVQKYKKFKSAK